MNWRTVFRSLKNRDMQKRLGIVLGLIVAYRFMAHIPVPLAEPSKLKDIINNVVASSDFGGFLNLLSGGALAQLSIVLVGMSPFITASIITQLLTKAIPRLEELHKDGESGRRKINQWTRLVSVPLAVIQSIAFIYILRQSVLSGGTAGTVSTSPIEWVVAVVAMTAGSVLLMWLGELITEQGIGNGISLVIFAGIVSQLPTTLGTIITSLFDTTQGKLSVFGWFDLPISATAFWVVLAVSFLSLAILYMLVKINEAQRIITVNYAKRVSGNSAFVGQVLKATNNTNFAELSANLIKWFQAPNANAFASNDPGVLIYPIAYFVLVILFTYFYTGIVFNANEIAENLQKQGGFVEGVRPGQQTEK